MPVMPINAVARTNRPNFRVADHARENQAKPLEAGVSLYLLARISAANRVRISPASGRNNGRSIQDSRFNNNSPKFWKAVIAADIRFRLSV
jgi:hypothetical protein